MGSVYRKRRPGDQKGGRFIYNRDRLHKAGFDPKHKRKHRSIMKDMDNQIKELI